MSDMVPEVLNAALDSLFTPKEPGEQEYQGVDGLLYCRNCHTPVQCRVKLWGRDKIVPCLCRCQQEAMAEQTLPREGILVAQHHFHHGFVFIMCVIRHADDTQVARIKINGHGILSLLSPVLSVNHLYILYFITESKRKVTKLQIRNFVTF